MEWDETNNTVWAWTSAGSVYAYAWDMAPNSLEKAKVIYSTLLTAFSADLPIKIYYKVQASPTTTGTIGALKLVQAGVP